MKKKGENLRGQATEKLKKQLAEFEEKMRELKFKAEGAKSKNVKEGKSLRKEIARVLTELNTKERIKESKQK